MCIHPIKPASSESVNSAVEIGCLLQQHHMDLYQRRLRGVRYGWMQRIHRPQV